MTLATSMAARQGPISMAGHQICMQIWLAASLLSDSLALAGQVCVAQLYVLQFVLWIRFTFILAVINKQTQAA
jgi:hypothetical protein